MFVCCIHFLFICSVWKAWLNLTRRYCWTAGGTCLWIHCTDTLHAASLTNTQGPLPSCHGVLMCVRRSQARILKRFVLPSGIFSNSTKVISLFALAFFSLLIMQNPCESISKIMKNITDRKVIETYEDYREEIIKCLRIWNILNNVILRSVKTQRQHHSSSSSNNVDNNNNNKNKNNNNMHEATRQLSYSQFMTIFLLISVWILRYFFVLFLQTHNAHSLAETPFL